MLTIYLPLIELMTTGFYHGGTGGGKEDGLVRVGVGLAVLHYLVYTDYENACTTRQKTVNTLTGKASQKMIRAQPRYPIHKQVPAMTQRRPAMSARLSRPGTQVAGPNQNTPAQKKNVGTRINRHGNGFVETGSVSAFGD